ncbi:unnamed protein product, partial [Rotaria sp. Silwood1]
NPALYVQTYGAHLLDGASLVAQARSAGVVEDISAPGFVGYSAAAYGQESWGAASGLAGGVGLVAEGAEVADAGLALGGGFGSSSLYESSGWAAGGVSGWEGGVVDGGLGAGWNGGVVAGGWNGGVVAGGLGAGWNGGLLGSAAVVSGADAAFLNADSDYNGSLDREEFHNLLAQNL